ncbi:MAG: response regulator [Anaerolineales bacterium]
MALPAHILIADDDAGVRRLIELALRKDRYRLTMTANGARALAAIQADRPDLIIADLMMPEMTGLELLATLKSSPTLKHIPVIVVTAAGQQAHVEEARRLGAATCVLKPFAQGEFLATIRALLNQAQ